VVLFRPRTFLKETIGSNQSIMSDANPGSAASSFFGRHEFLIRRLHSLSGLVPVGAYMVVHLTVNASILNGPGTFQSNVYGIHALDKLLPVVEWAFIFTPLLFHALVGVWIARTGRSNTRHYKFPSNRRYSWQRWSGMIALVFILTHVFHLHGWFHSGWWLKQVAEPLGMAQFRPFNAASSLAMAMQGAVWPIFYAIGILACTFHLANGIWTAGITWGLWLTPAAQRRAGWVCVAFGALIGLIGMSALAGVRQVNVEEAIEIENQMYSAREQSGEIRPNPKKRLSGADDAVIAASEPDQDVGGLPVSDPGGSSVQRVR
jgi:succinate dehydrogenase / fumarate reductase cytochrome b subunit